MSYRDAHIDNQYKLAPIAKSSLFRNIALVCLLSFATLWLNTATAAHIHLHEHAVHCDMCLSSSSGGATLETRPPTLKIEKITSEHVVFNYDKPQLVPVAPRKSRAPPFNL
ncbi:MAG: hypothetical protein QNK31_03820 [Porticoccus sp.]|nr:hypothetical protein [Porticoccus sp.]